MYVTKSEIESTAERLKERWAACKAIPGTRKYHQFKVSSEEIIGLVNSNHQAERDLDQRKNTGKNQT